MLVLDNKITSGAYDTLAFFGFAEVPIRGTRMSYTYKLSRDTFLLGSLFDEVWDYRITEQVID